MGTNHKEATDMTADRDKPAKTEPPATPEKPDLTATLDAAAQAARKRGRPGTAEVLERLKPKD